MKVTQFSKGQDPDQVGARLARRDKHGMHRVGIVMGGAGGDGGGDGDTTRSNFPFPSFPSPASLLYPIPPC
jgi:hypothetical protein